MRVALVHGSSGRLFVGPRTIAFVTSADADLLAVLRGDDDDPFRALASHLVARNFEVTPFAAIDRVRGRLFVSGQLVVQVDDEAVRGDDSSTWAERALTPTAAIMCRIGDGPVVSDSVWIEGGCVPADGFALGAAPAHGEATDARAASQPSAPPAAMAPIDEPDTAPASLDPGTPQPITVDGPDPVRARSILDDPGIDLEQLGSRSRPAPTVSGDDAGDDPGDVDDDDYTHLPDADTPTVTGTGDPTAAAIEAAPAPIASTHATPTPRVGRPANPTPTAADQTTTEATAGGTGFREPPPIGLGARPADPASEPAPTAPASTGSTAQVILGDGRSFDIPVGMLIGRYPEKLGVAEGYTTATVAGHHVSRVHLELRVTAARSLYARDCNTPNGSVHRSGGTSSSLTSSEPGAELNVGDVIEFGDQTLRFAQWTDG